MSAPVIWWIRQDMRLFDNPTLAAARSASPAVIPLFIIDPGLAHVRAVAPRRWAFLVDGLRALDAALRAMGGVLIVREGSPEVVLQGLMAETGAQAIFAQAGVTAYALQRDVAVGRSLPLRLVGWPTIYDPRALMRDEDRPYVIFSAFRRRWLDLLSIDPPALYPAPSRWEMPSGIITLPVPTLPPDPAFPGGEGEARRRLAAFFAGEKAPIFQYRRFRDRADRAWSSRLSPYLRFGMLSPRQAVVAALEALSYAPDLEAQQSVWAWINELIWREFFLVLGFARFHRGWRSERRGSRQIQTRKDRGALEAWKKGRTGYPLVDAGMRQLAAEGWLPNRIRMVVAAFLTKDLGMGWRAGASWFMEQLIDGDPVVNTGNWWWVAGLGLDPRPRRTFNIIRQSRRADPLGDYIRRWVPELAAVPKEYLYSPWCMPREAQRAARCRIGWDYPSPLGLQPKEGL